jgi:hypothetical protein
MNVYLTSSISKSEVYVKCTDTCDVYFSSILVRVKYTDPADKTYTTILNVYVWSMLEVSVGLHVTQLNTPHEEVIKLLANEAKCILISLC